MRHSGQSSSWTSMNRRGATTGLCACFWPAAWRGPAGQPTHMLQNGVRGKCLVWIVCLAATVEPF